MATPTGTMTSREDKSPNSLKQPIRTSLEIWTEEMHLDLDKEMAEIERYRRLNQEREERAKKQMPR